MPIANPTIVNYKPFYIQIPPATEQQTTTAKDTKAEWGLVAKSNPFPALPNPKEPYKNDWKDENGDDEYVASMYYEAFEFEVKFYIKAKSTVSGGSVTETAEEIIRSNMSSFFNTIKQGSFSIFDSYTGLGRQKVRYAGFSEDTFVSRRSNGSDRSVDWAYAIFTVKFKVNDPVTMMRLNGNQIVAI